MKMQRRQMVKSMLASVAGITLSKFALAASTLRDIKTNVQDDASR